MNFQDFIYYLNRLRDNPKRLLKVFSSPNARGILFYLPFEPSVVKFVSTLTNSNRQEILNLQRELTNNSFLFDIKESFLKVRGIPLISCQKWHELIFLLIRSLKPKIVVETGVFDGLSSAFILYAFYLNNFGSLYSIDLPARGKIFNSTDEMSLTRLPRGKSPGWLVPSYLKKRWRLTLGLSENQLSPLLKRLKKIDIFIHDSLHTYAHMSWEYSTSWEILRKRGLLCSDDIFTTRAFAYFSQKKKKSFIQKGGFGVILK